ncbi:hypothetical protein ma526 [Moumouvirus australiensis]|uniref:Uncharacterized protein n=1 Tax=Moumouvirus australiensis TaxID=2109587 RepID=A0A2P1EM11_9VIRU|nr:hypothetical protein QKC55_gp379 [Moumouvirus australiensis]AVL94912.1 hypothetical protein ma526 [Moumouvirus australiensis]
MDCKTDKLIEKLENIDSNKKSSHKTSQNKNICKLLKNITNFYDNIYIPYKYFQNDKWNINKTLNNNEDVLFFNQEILFEEHFDRFYEVFDKYILLMEDIFNPKNMLNPFLKKISDIDIENNEKAKFLIKIINSRRYKYISPEYIINQYVKIKNQYIDENEVQNILREDLNEIISNTKKYVKEFGEEYKHHVCKYISEYPFEENLQQSYTKTFLNDVLLSIYNCCDKLLDLKIYACHVIILGIIDSTLPLDDIYFYEPENNKNKSLIIV